MNTLPPHPGGRERGFTLTEVVLVVLIVAVLLALAVPTFIGAQNKAKDHVAQSSARKALADAKTIFADTGAYASVDVAKLVTSEPSLTFVDGATHRVAPADSGPTTVSVLATPTAWYGAVRSETGTCFYVVDSVDTTGVGGTKYAKAKDVPADDCVASATRPAAGDYRDKW